MKTISIEIEGVTPLLMNRFTEAAQEKVENGTTVVAVGDRGTPRDVAADKRYRDAAGNLYIPGVNIFAAVIAAGKFHKVGASKVTTQKSSLVPAAITMLSVECWLDTKEYEVDSRPVVIPKTGGRIMCHRPRLDTWKTVFEIEVDEKMFKPQFVRQLIDDAGRRIGIGDFRPDRKGPFGRFVVTRWEVDGGAKEAAA